MYIIICNILSIQYISDMIIFVADSKGLYLDDIPHHINY